AAARRVLPAGDRPAGPGARYQQPRRRDLDGVGQVDMVPDDLPGMVEHDLRAVEVEGRGDDVLGRQAAQEPPEADGGAAVALAVARGDGDAAQPIAEAAVGSRTRLAERLVLPVVELDAEVRREGPEVVDDMLHVPLYHAARRGPVRRMLWRL